MIETFLNYLSDSGFGQFQWPNLVMIGVGLTFIFLAIKKGFEPLLLVPIGFGILIGNIPYDASKLSLGVYDGPVSDRDIAYVMLDKENGELVDAQILSEAERHHGTVFVHEGSAVMVNQHALFSAKGELAQAWTDYVDQLAAAEAAGEPIPNPPPPTMQNLGQGRTIFVSAATLHEGGKFPQVWSDEKQDIFNASVLWFLFAGVGLAGFYPPLIFLGVGALTDFGPMLSRPKTLLLGAAAQFGIFGALIGAVAIGFTAKEAGAIGIIGGADGPTAIFTCSQLAPDLLGPVALAAYSYMAMVPIIQPPIMRLLTTKEERLIRMVEAKPVSKQTKILFPIACFLLTAFIAPGALPLLGMLFFGNLLRECMVTDRLAKTAQSTFIDIITILLGITVGAKTNAANFLTLQTIGIFALGILAFILATATGVLFAKLMNKISRATGGEAINPLIGAAGVSAVPMAARVVHTVGQKEDPQNYLLMHAMGPNVAGVIGSAVAAGVLLSKLNT